MGTILWEELQQSSVNNAACPCLDKAFSADGWWLWFESKLQRLPVSVSGRCHQMSASSWSEVAVWFRWKLCRGLLWTNLGSLWVALHTAFAYDWDLCASVLCNWIGLRNNPLQIVFLLPPVGLKAGLERKFGSFEFGFRVHLGSCDDIPSQLLSVVFLEHHSWRCYWQHSADKCSIPPAPDHCIHVTWLLFESPALSSGCQFVAQAKVAHVSYQTITLLVLAILCTVAYCRSHKLVATKTITSLTSLSRKKLLLLPQLLHLSTSSVMCYVF